jgi:hypothetical protein
MPQVSGKVSGTLKLLLERPYTGAKAAHACLQVVWHKSFVPLYFWRAHLIDSLVTATFGGVSSALLSHCNSLSPKLSRRVADAMALRLRWHRTEQCCYQIATKQQLISIPGRSDPRQPFFSQHLRVY